MAYLALRVVIAVLIRLLLILFMYFTGHKMAQRSKKLGYGTFNGLSLALSRRFDFYQSSSGTGQDYFEPFY